MDRPVNRLVRDSAFLRDALIFGHGIVPLGPKALRKALLERKTILFRQLFYQLQNVVHRRMALHRAPHRDATVQANVA